MLPGGIISPCQEVNNPSMTCITSRTGREHEWNSALPVCAEEEVVPHGGTVLRLTFAHKCQSSNAASD